MIKNYIPLHEPNFNGNEIKYLKKCIDSTWVSTSGYFIDKFEEQISNYTKSKYAIACINGTSALQISLLVSNVKKGDEVIVPTITFIAPVNAVKYNGASPIFMDCDDFYNIDEKKTIEFIVQNTNFKNGFTYNKKTKKIIKAIIIVHTFGNAAKIEKLISICRKRNIKIIEDASESLGSFYKKNKKHTGTIGDFGIISFNGNKIITAGAGGMILTNNKKKSEYIRYLIKQAKNDSLNFIHNNVGFNFSISNLNAAIGLAQFEKLDDILEKKKKIRNKYFKTISLIQDIKFVNQPLHSVNNNWLNLIQTHSGLKNKLIKLFLSENIAVRPVWYPNHKQKMYKKCEKFKIEKASQLFDSTICLPSSYNLSSIEFKKIINILKNFNY